MDNVLIISHVTKKFGHQLALNDVSMNIHQGDIYGLIGRNGAGKTTLLKTVVQLTQVSAGSVQLFGSQNEKEYLEQLKRVGSIIETPVAYDQLTALQNLTYYCKLRGIADPDAPQQALTFVELANTGKKKYKDFSLGMKQKLGLAIALLNQPDFLILDEPINGLDPVAIAEFRELLMKLNRERKITILISSHILDELFHVANRFGFINDGQMIHEISKKDFEEESKEFLRINIDDAAKAAVILQKLGIQAYKVVNGQQINVYDLTIDPATINQQLVLSQVMVASLNKEGQNLEMYFKNLIGK